MKKIDFKQPKYIFPLVLLLPILFLAYIVCDLFRPGEDVVAQEGLQTELPDAMSVDVQDKYSAMYLRYGYDEESISALRELEIEKEARDSIGSVYSDEEIDRLAMEEQQRKEMEENLRKLQDNVGARGRQGRPRISDIYSGQRGEDRRYADGSDGLSEDDRGMVDYAEQVRSIKAAQDERRVLLARALGISDEPQKKPDSVPAPPKPEPPMLVWRDKEANANRFNTIGDAVEAAENTLIRAMIDKTTKAQQGTRLRFKLLDDVTIKDVKLKKGTYLYGTVIGFGEQRVKASINSIMIGNRFLKVDLSVYDNDGMEGFYVPESAFREFLKNASAGVTQQNININSGYGSEITGESLALQALQNVYNSASQAISANVRKNKAKIKYNTVVYLVNSRDAE